LKLPPACVAVGGDVRGIGETFTANPVTGKTDI
jgi:hypothetical protein